MCNTYCFPTATVVARTRLIATCMACLVHHIESVHLFHYSRFVVLCYFVFVIVRACWVYANARGEIEQRSSRRAGVQTACTLLQEASSTALPYIIDARFAPAPCCQSSTQSRH